LLTVSISYAIYPLDNRDRTRNRYKHKRRTNMDKFKTFRLIAALACLVLTLALTSVGAARAASVPPLPGPSPQIMSAAEFAAACNATIRFTVKVDTLVTGGSGTINPYACWVHVAPFVSLTFDQVRLDSPTGSSVGLAVDGGDSSQVHVHQSIMVMDGGLFLIPGGSEPGGVDGNNALLEVSQSTLRSTYVSGEVRLFASACKDGGTVQVSQSEISAPSVVYIFASAGSDPGHGCGGSNGTVQVTQSAITTTVGPTVIATGNGGRTSVLQNTFAGGGVRIAGGASCKALYNIPDTPCS
jgi:hypothetical protein